MTEKIYNCPCPKIRNYQEKTNKIIRSVNGKPIISEQMLFFNDVFLCGLVWNHAKEGCSFCCSILEKGEFEIFYAFKRKLDFKSFLSKI